MTRNKESFVSAKPIWLAGREEEMNLLAGFRAVVRKPPAGSRIVLRIAASSLYRIFINGRFAGHGPARGPHGYYRVDEWDVSDRFLPGRNIVAVEVAGYNVNSYYLLDQPAFVQAELLADGKPLASTGGGKGARFAGRQLHERVQKVQRYSYQRTFIEIWRPTPTSDSWRNDPSAKFVAERTAVVADKQLLPRRVPIPQFHLRQPTRHIARGRIRTGVHVAEPWMDRSLKNIGPDFKGFPLEQLDIIPSLELQTIKTATITSLDQVCHPDQPVALTANSFRILDLGTNLTGFIGLTVNCRKKTRLYVLFDELLTKAGDVNFSRMESVNAILYEMPPGLYTLESFEPYTLRYLKLMTVGNGCEISGVNLREYTNPQAGRASFAASDDRLNRLFEAGRETFAQNSVDLFMDCPSRERAGWLSDSFFSARVAADLCGNTCVEKAFYENYLLPQRFPNLPVGMLPMCYPADHPTGNFIPNWGLWFVLELEEYLARSGDRLMVDALRMRVLALFDYFKKFLNSDGLLEKLEKWVFIEWSAANDFVQDVNYPSNALYAGALDAAARIYHLPKLAAEAKRVRATIRRQSFDGEFFVDNAIRENGQLRITKNRSEVCQYFAFYFGVATPKTHAKLYQRLCEDFGPRRMKRGAFADVHPAAPFIGNVLRLELLSRWGRAEQILDESVDYLLYMADRTGTLWEMADEKASCNHAFASHVCHVLLRDVLGIAEIDSVGRRVCLKFNNIKLDWCRGRVPVPGGFISVEWHRKKGRVVHRVDVPAGYTVDLVPGCMTKSIP